MKFIQTLLIVAISGTFLWGQIQTPQPSPLATLTQIVGVSEVSVTYSRPGIKGRTIFGELVPYGQVWRTGANASTKLKFSHDVKLEGNPVPAGEYSLYTVPGEQEWKIIINKKLDSGGRHVAEEDLLSFKVKPRTVPLPVERFTIDIADMTDNSATIVLKWVQTEVNFKLEVDTDAIVMQSIRDFAGSGSQEAGGYYQAANYYFENRKDINDALKWVNKSLEINEKPFWVLRLKARILAAKGDYEEAIVFAKKSLVSAQQAGNEQFVKMNEAHIAEWEKQL